LRNSPLGCSEASRNSPAGDGPENDDSKLTNYGGIPTPLKNMKVIWDAYSQYMESHKIHVPNHQSVTCKITIFKR
jgi:hypothetical protein